MFIHHNFKGIEYSDSFESYFRLQCRSNKDDINDLEAVECKVKAGIEFIAKIIEVLYKKNIINIEDINDMMPFPGGKITSINDTM